MATLLIAHAQFPEAWRNAFETVFSGEGLSIWPHMDDPAIFDCAIVARPEGGVLSRLPNLRLISSTGMGVDHILGLPDLPRHVPLCRVVTAEMVDQVSEYVTLAVLRAERDSDLFDQLQRQAKWERRMTGRSTGKRRVGILGWGAVAREAARRLVFLGFTVEAWARSSRVDGGVEVRSGRNGFEAVMAQSEVILCALPATRATDGLLNAETLALLPIGAHVVNVGRGEHIVDEALLDALDRGQLSGATLDVFRTEPLPVGHPFWRHGGVRVTPHSAGLLSPADSAKAIHRNLLLVRAGHAPENLVDIDACY